MPNIGPFQRVASFGDPHPKRIPSHINELQEALEVLDGAPNGAEFGAIDPGAPGATGQVLGNQQWVTPSADQAYDAVSRAATPALHLSNWDVGYIAPSDALASDKQRAGAVLQDDGDNITRINWARDKVKGGRGGTLRLARGTSIIESPLILPRSGVNMQNAVHVQGDHSRAAVLTAPLTFPAGRALIEWETTATRTYRQRIGHLGISLPNVNNVRAIHYKLQTANPTYAQMSAERIEIELSNIYIEAHNLHHPDLIYLEGSIFKSRIDNIVADPILPNQFGILEYGGHDTLLLRVDHTFSAGVPYNTIDGPGLNYSEVRSIWPMMMRGGFCRAFEGRLYQSAFANSFSNGGRKQNQAGTTTNVSYNFVNCSGATIENIMCEGRAEAQIRVTKGHTVLLRNVAPNTPKSPFSAWEADTAYTFGQRVVPTSMTGYGSRASGPNRYALVNSPGTSGPSEPTWHTSGTVDDGTMQWLVPNEDFFSDGIVIEDSFNIKIDGRNAAGNQIPASHRGVKALRINSGSSEVTVDSFLVTKSPEGGAALTDEYADDGTNNTLNVKEATTIGTIGGADQETGA